MHFDGSLEGVSLEKKKRKTVVMSRLGETSENRRLMVVMVTSGRSQRCGSVWEHMPPASQSISI